MVARIHSNSSTPISLFGCTIACAYPGLDWSRFSRTVAAHDLLLQHLNQGKFFVPVGLVDVCKAFGFLGCYPSDTIEISGKPRQISLAYRDALDARYYGNISRNFKLLSNVLTGSVDFIPNYSHESSCRHGTFIGELATRQSDLQSSRSDYLFYGALVPLRWTSGRLYYKCRVDSTFPLNVTALYEDSSTSIFNILDLLDYIIEQGTIGDISNANSGQIRSLSDLSYTVDTSGLTISYKSSLLTGNSPVPGTSNDVRTWKSRVFVPFEVPAPYFYPIQSQVYNGLLTVDHCTFSYSDGFALHQDAEGVFEDTYTNSDVDEFVFLSDPTGVVLENEGGHRFVPTSLGASLHNFEEAILNEYDDIVPASLFSTADAFKDSERSLNVNILQNLAKLPDIASALPHIREGIDVASRLLRRDFSLSTLREVLDLVTSTELQRSFEWRPYLDVFTTYLPQLASLWGTLGHFTQNSIGRGSWFFRFPDKVFGRQDVTLTARSKIVMDTSGSALLSSLLGADAVGVLPKASNIWDLIPFTFVVNWFTGVGGMIRRAEYSAYLLTLPAYYVHTYTLSSPFSSQELEAWNLRSFSEQSAGLRVYYRDLSLFSPLPRDSRFGFGLPQGLPPVGTFTSLLYQLFG